MICDAEDFVKIAKEVAKELSKGFSEAQEIIIKELARQIAIEKVREHEESGYHA
jgi:hypothetical protein